MEKNNLTNGNKIAIIAIALTLLITTVGVSFAAFYTRTPQAGSDVIGTTCFDTEYTESSSMVNLAYAVPISNEEGLASTPLSFTIKNKCDVSEKYYIILNVKSSDGNEANLISPEYINISLNNGSPTFLTQYPEASTVGYTDSNYNKSYVLTSGTLTKGQSVSYQTRNWINGNTTYDNVSEKSWTGKIVIYTRVNTSEQASTMPEVTQTLTDKIRLSAKTTKPNFTQVAQETGVYSMEDDYGTSYYFRGNVTNNYVKFGKWTEEVYRGYVADKSVYKEYFTQPECLAAGTDTYDYGHDCNKSPVAGKDMYWRIVRLNGDGTLRLLYDGTEPHANGEESADRAVSISQFNDNNDPNVPMGVYNPVYVGYMYGDINGATYDAVHANTNNSIIKTYLDSWYETNIKNKGLAGYVSDTLFCNDRSGPDGTGIGNGTAAYYGASNRVSTANPILTCPQKNDAFTVNDTTKGNGALKYPVGLLTADEYMLAGGKASTSVTNLYISKPGVDWWLGSPFGAVPEPWMFYSNNAGGLEEYGAVFYGYAVVPVINLSAEYTNQLKGSGTMDDPYHF